MTGGQRRAIALALSTLLTVGALAWWLYVSAYVNPRLAALHGRQARTARGMVVRKQSAPSRFGELRTLTARYRDDAGRFHEVRDDYDEQTQNWEALAVGQAVEVRYLQDEPDLAIVHGSDGWNGPQTRRDVSVALIGAAVGLALTVVALLARRKTTEGPVHSG